MGPSKNTRQRSDKATEPTRQSSRNRQPAERRAAADDAAQRDAANRVREQRRKEKRKEQRDEVEQRDLVVEQDDESEKVRHLEEELGRMRIERDAAVHAAEEQSVSSKARVDNPAPDSIPRPKNMNKIKISDIREKLNLMGEENKPEWLDLRQVVRDMTTAGFIDWALNWRSQKSKKLGKIYDAVEENVPALRRFHNQWGTELLVKEFFQTHKTYKSCIKNPRSYRAKVSRARAQHRLTRRRASARDVSRAPSVSDDLHPRAEGDVNMDVDEDDRMEGSSGLSYEEKNGSDSELSDIDDDDDDEEGIN
ncbi:hypothetical protein GGG16DRAFT_63211 [Schizophyllum commune]